MKQVAVLANLSLSAIRNRRAKAAWVWSCAINTTPKAKRPAYVWLESDLQKALNALRVASPACPANVRPSVVRDGRTQRNGTAKLALVIDLSEQRKRNLERQRRKADRREAMGLAG